MINTYRGNAKFLPNIFYEDLRENKKHTLDQRGFFVPPYLK